MCTTIVWCIKPIASSKGQHPKQVAVAPWPSHKPITAPPPHTGQLDITRHAKRNELKGGAKNWSQTLGIHTFGFHPNLCCPHGYRKQCGLFRLYLQIVECKSAIVHTHQQTTVSQSTNPCLCLLLGCTFEDWGISLHRPRLAPHIGHIRALSPTTLSPRHNLLAWQEGFTKSDYLSLRHGKILWSSCVRTYVRTSL